MTNSMDPDRTAPVGAVLSGSTLFGSILKFVSNVRQLFAADDFRRHIVKETYDIVYILIFCLIFSSNIIT